MGPYRWIGCAALLLLSAGCTGVQHGSRAAPTFTPAPAVSGARLPSPAPSNAVVRADCLRSLSSYRFTGSFSFKGASENGSGPAGSGGLAAGSLANLLSDVSFTGEALAPDRYHGVISFGGGGAQNLEIIRIGSQSYSRFGSAAWQGGDQSAELGGIGRLDPESLCERSLVQLTAAGKTPVHETVNAIAALRYDVTGPQVARALGAGPPRTPVPASAAPEPAASVWVAEKGGYPVRIVLAGASAAGSLNLHLDISDVNGKDIRIDPPD